MRGGLGLVAALALAGAAQAQADGGSDGGGGLRKFCADRPGLTIAPCTLDAGHLQAELGLADWTRERTPDEHRDTVEGAQALLRYGAGPTTELRLAWTAYGHVRERDPDDGTLTRTSSVGDVTLGIKQNLLQPDGQKLSIALLPRATLPAGRMPFGAGTWGFNLLVPIAYELTDGLQLTVNPRIDAAPDMAGHGRHLAYSNIVGLEAEVVDHVNLDLEVQAIRDRDPSGHHTEALASAALDWTLHDRLQFDLGGVAGLNRWSPTVELYCGISRRF